MGRKTWLSLPKKPLPNRLNIVLSRDSSFSADGAIVFDDINKAIKHGKKSLYIIGGSEIYDLAMKLGVVDRIIASHVDGVHECDAFFPKLSSDWELVDTVPYEKFTIKDFRFKKS